ncbi:GNAT family N-acetyltransferase [Bacillus pseudomycoides]|uniref:GNAT family N-acetyltransferase n=1 Tax=Bacillus pseudomycoides TaxID=64104 RepID=UPI000BEE2D64|nr:GNAT family N-acetyltransferase [Bacillus pseudomycoides]PEF73614.1 GNAT family N-acetyltransferase [Bacillus pseudomycoides]PEJ39002.1 GNAT family N-acetyltransferase [Bacillus pseudomycoides]PEL86626.1 GNAT family N-acetyltransferase [Bacillus pseudomycoides]PGE96832.1 GNAT family N-acetyltransferase [Bacillus pseudomycoides]PHA80286.1 GNAT family N-acetyltransferase [Bacillus pseudomycoides]
MNLHITKELNGTDKNSVNNRLYEYNLKYFPVDLRGRYQEINLFLKDENSKVRGGILGEICWNWLEIHTFIIDEDIRKLGYGTKLLLEIEQIALEKNCDFIKVDTLSFQALDFYKKHGYQEFGVLDNVGRDYKHYYLKKDL